MNLLLSLTSTFNPLAISMRHLYTLHKIYCILFKHLTNLTSRLASYKCKNLIVLFMRESMKVTVSKFISFER